MFKKKRANLREKYISNKKICTTPQEKINQSENLFSWCWIYWLDMMAYFAAAGVSEKRGQNRSPSNKHSVFVCLSDYHPVESQMGVCEEDYYCKPALPAQSPSPRFPRPRFHHPSCALLEIVWKAICQKSCGPTLKNIQETV